MLTDDDQFANFLTMNGLLEPDAVARMRIAAELEEKPLYVTVIEKGAVGEERLVSMMSSLLGLASVSLAEFEGDPDVLGRIPRELIRGLGVLPVGIDDSSGTALLYVAMANPMDAEALNQVRATAGLAVVPLLAGPVDLLRAIERAEAALSGAPQTHGFSRAPKDSFPTGMPSADDAVDLVDDLGGASMGTARSALSLLDDIPRNRHEQPTSPSGVISLADFAAESASAPEDSAGLSGLKLASEAEGTMANIATAETAYFDANNLLPDPAAESGFVRFGAQRPLGPSSPSQPIPLQQPPSPRPAIAPALGSGSSLGPSADPSDRTGMGFPASPAPSGPFRRIGGTPLSGVSPAVGAGGPFGAPGTAAMGTGAFPSATNPAASSLGLGGLGGAAGISGRGFSGAFSAAMSAPGEGDVVMTERPDDLIRALASILLRRGLITERELRDELVKIRAAGGR